MSKTEEIRTALDVLLNPIEAIVARPVNIDLYIAALNGWLGKLTG